MAIRIRAALADADVIATTSFLAGPDVPLAVRQRYQADIAQAAADLATLRSAGGQAAGSPAAARLSAISTGLPVYAGCDGRAPASAPARGGQRPAARAVHRARPASRPARRA